MVPADDQAIVFLCASVMVIMVLLKVALTCATPEAMFLRSRRRTRAGSFPILDPLSAPHRGRRVNHRFYCDTEKLAPARNGGIGARQLTSSCPQSAWPDPCVCGRWCGCAAREQAGHDGAATHDSSQDPSAA